MLKTVNVCNVYQVIGKLLKNQIGIIIKRIQSISLYLFAFGNSSKLADLYTYYISDTITVCLQN